VSGDALCHALLWAAAEECAALGVPLQVHTGFGDPDEDLAEASPLGLRPLLREEGLRGLRVVLLHTYPYHREAAYLCSVYPDVYMDLSLAIPLAAADGARALAEALGLCPWTKLLYASDASRLPELYFVAGVLHRQALADALGALVSDGTLTPSLAEEAGRQVLAGNARRVYRLDGG
jgi:predicted TIM-barrel fold metal-dependent hydrolase